MSTDFASMKLIAMRAYKAEWAAKWRAEHPEEARAKKAAWRAKNKEHERQQRLADYAANREEKRAKARAYQKTEAGAAYHLAYYQKNKEQYRIQLQKWRIANHERARALASNRSARERGAHGTHTAAEVKKLFSLQRGCCAVCRVAISSGYHKDHIVALSIGGSNDISNIQLLCPSCNTSKGAKDQIDFMQSKGMLL